MEEEKQDIEVDIEQVRKSDTGLIPSLLYFNCEAVITGETVQLGVRDF